MINEKKTNIRVEMSADTIARLLAEGRVCAAEFRCLDCRSKQCLWRLCLESCANYVPVTTDSNSQWNCLRQPCRPWRKCNDDGGDGN